MWIDPKFKSIYISSFLHVFFPDVDWPQVQIPESHWCGEMHSWILRGKLSPTQMYKEQMGQIKCMGWFLTHNHKSTRYERAW